MRRRPLLTILGSLVAGAAMAGVARSAASEVDRARVDFARDIAPLFERHCIRCHQSSNKQGELSLATLADVEETGYVVAGDPAASHLLEAVSSVGGEQPLMPKEGPPLTDEEVELLRAWIAEGAAWPAEIVVRERPKADRSWWALRPLAKREPPSDGVPAAWSGNPIDRFVYAQLRASNLEPNARADDRTILRRVAYDLTGLPAPPDVADEFLGDPSLGAYERLVDRLLASPRYGEHWGRHWLDVTRFGESTGYEVNHLVDNAWPFRDYVIESFNEDKPFDQWVMEHLAGDVAGGGHPDVEVGLTFLVCGPVDIVGNSDAAKARQIRADAVDEIIRAASEAFLGLTIGCARCHDHKFDPVTQQDYYRLYATFNGVFHADREVGPDDQLRGRDQRRAALEARKQALNAEKSAAQSATPQELDDQLAEIDQQLAALPTFPSLRVGRFELPGEPPRVFIGGDANRPGEAVSAGSIGTLEDVAAPYTIADSAAEQDRRAAFARWLVAADNPLTPRVLANRVWHYHFGTGIVATTSDFGYMGDRPSHPELLDWLAAYLQENSWRLKALHKLIVMSETYRQSSAFRAAAAQVDGDARLLWRFPPRRLAAEEIRDTMLLLAGKLDERRGGPGFQLYSYSRDNVATYTPLAQFGPETYRRSVYHQNARAANVDLLTDFDAPDCAFSVSRRVPTTNPAQALAMMNHRFTIDMAEAFAERLASQAGPEGGDGESQVRRAFELALAREPDAVELAVATQLVERHGLRAFCRALLNASELIYVN